MIGKTLEDIIREVLDAPAGTIKHIDIFHEEGCDGQPCNCEPEYKEQRRPQ